MKPTKKRSSAALAKKTGSGSVNAVYQSIVAILGAARSASYCAVNQAMVQAYWHIGRVIVEEEQKGRQRARYGEELIVELAQRLTKDFGKGFDKSDLWHMRKFYLTFPDFLDAPRRELSWTHYRLLLRIEKKRRVTST